MDFCDLLLSSCALWVLPLFQDQQYVQIVLLDSLPMDRAALLVNPVTRDRILTLGRRATCVLLGFLQQIKTQRLARAVQRAAMQAISIAHPARYATQARTQQSLVPTRPVHVWTVPRALLVLLRVRRRTAYVSLVPMLAIPPARSAHYAQ